METKEIAPYTRIDLGDVTPHNIKLLKKVNQVVFPIVFDDKFYKDVLESGEYAKLAYYNDVVVGAVCCRVVVTSKSFSEALILASTNPQYYKRLFVELPVQHMKTIRAEHGKNKFCACSAHVLHRG